MSLLYGLGQTFGNLSVGLLKDSIGMVGIMWRYGIMTIIILILTTFYFYGRRKGQVAA
jgi:predicted MFS family arabinose efflux permease